MIVAELVKNLLACPQQAEVVCSIQVQLSPRMDMSTLKPINSVAWSNKQDKVVLSDAYGVPRN
jgi:hypothetical protein